MLQSASVGNVMDFNLVVDPAEHEWQELVDASPQGAIFSDLRYLRALEAPCVRYLVKTPHGEVLGGVAVMGNGVAMHPAPFPYTPYQGILFGPSIAKQASHKRVVSEFRVTEFLIHSLLDRYENFSMALSPAFSDLRPFLWHNYHDPEARHFTVRTRYTALLSLAGFRLDDYLTTIRSVRRQEVRKNSAEITETTDVEQFLKLYGMTFGRQGLVINPDQLGLVERIVRGAIAGGYGRLAAATTPDGIASMTLFVYDKRTGYYLFGANDPALRSGGASTALLVDNIRNMSERGLERVDFVGVNSPNRGDFKLSFNPELALYHEVQLDESGAS